MLPGKQNDFSVQMGHWTTSASSPNLFFFFFFFFFFFKKVEIFISLEVYTYAKYYLQLQLSYKDICIFSEAISKSRLLKMDATVMTAEFDTIHYLF